MAEKLAMPSHLRRRFKSASTSSIMIMGFMKYRQPSNISRTLVGNRIVDRSASSNALLQLHLHSRPGFNRLRKDNFKTRRERYSFWDFLRLILEVWRLAEQETKISGLPYDMLSIIDHAQTNSHYVLNNCWVFQRHDIDYHFCAPNTITSCIIFDLVWFVQVLIDSNSISPFVQHDFCWI